MPLNKETKPNKRIDMLCLGFSCSISTLKNYFKKPKTFYKKNFLHKNLPPVDIFTMYSSGDETLQLVADDNLVVVHDFTKYIYIYIYIYISITSSSKNKYTIFIQFYF